MSNPEDGLFVIHPRKRKWMLGAQIESIDAFATTIIQIAKDYPQNYLVVEDKDIQKMLVLEEQFHKLVKTYSSSKKLKFVSDEKRREIQNTFDWLVKIIKDTVWMPAPGQRHKVSEFGEIIKMLLHEIEIYTTNCVTDYCIKFDK